MHTTRRLRLDKVLETITTLRLRVSDRFPGSGLAGWAIELENLGADVAQQAAKISRPLYWVWALAAGVVLFLGGVIVVLVRGVHTSGTLNWSEVASGVDAITSELVLLIALVVFLASLQTRIRRWRVVAAIRRLRELAHVIDMLQLTKDPGGIAGVSLPSLAHSPRRDLSPLELARYLDYCSEMLSLLSKLAQFFVADFDDPEATEAVTDLERLTDGLSRKIWQKIMILHQEGLPEAPRPRT